MKFSEAWLREFVNPDLTTAELVDQLTMAGLEVNGVEPAAAEFSNVVVGEVLRVEPHPDADRLVVCQVASGREELQVVYGAPDARAGLKVPLALVGATFPNLKVKKAKLRGVESFGMLCSERELGISDNHEGLMELPLDAPVGTDLVDYLSLSDSIIDIDLPPNRGDCLSMVGLARETGLINSLDVKNAAVSAVPPTIDDTFPVELAAGSACPRFVGRVIRGVDPTAESPLWLKEKLRRSDIRSIDPIVDVTNFVMLELGQPLHAYDRARLQGGVIVRHSRTGEKVTLLDGQEVALHDGTLLIADGSGPIGIAGIMGGLSTSVTDVTRDIFLESAFFEPRVIAGRARSYNMSTDAAHRFERGVDWQGQKRAVERATELLIQIVGGEPGPVVEAVDESALPGTHTITLRLARINKLLGVEIEEDSVDEILNRLDFDVTRTRNKNKDRWLAGWLADKLAGRRAGGRVSWQVRAPSHRFDISIEADLIEEVSRVFGYNRLPVRTPVATLQMSPIPEATAPSKQSLRRLRDQLVSRGYFEAITYSFVDAGLQRLLDPESEPVALANPLSAEMSVMRTTIWAGLLKSLLYNINRQQSRIRLFETGLCFRRARNQAELKYADITQVQKLAAVACGSKQAEGWSNDTTAIDFYDIKGDLESILALTGEPEKFEFAAARHPALHPGQCAEIRKRGEPVGYAGLLDPGLQQQLDIRYPTFLFEISVDAVLGRRLPQSTSISRFPDVRRDIAMIIDQTVTFAQIRSAVQMVTAETLINLKLFDVYHGKGIDPNRKSIALGLTFQHSSRTLTDEEVSSSVDRIVTRLGKELDASLRN